MEEEKEEEDNESKKTEKTKEKKKIHTDGARGYILSGYDGLTWQDDCMWSVWVLPWLFSVVSHTDKSIFVPRYILDLFIAF